MIRTCIVTQDLDEDTDAASVAVYSIITLSDPRVMGAH